MTHPFLRKLQSYVHLSDADRMWLTEALGPPRAVAARADISAEGDEPRVNVLLEGWACRYRQFADGRRQIVSLLLPGEACDPDILLLDRQDHATGALTRCTLAPISGAALRALTARSPALDYALRREVLATASIQREWTASLGRRSAIERLAHLFCELHARLTAVGLAQGSSYPMPLTQSDLADALGQTSVHINRTLRDLRGLGLVSLVNRCLIVHDPSGLAELAHFDAAYLHLTTRAGRR